MTDGSDDRAGLEETPDDADRRGMSDRSKLTGWEIVRRAEALHPEWTLEQHVAHLSEDEGWDIDPIWSPAGSGTSRLTRAGDPLEADF
jgi:hypothetical protein